MPVLQLLAKNASELPFPAGTDVLQVLWCPFDHEPWSSPRPQTRWRRRAEIGALRPRMPMPHTDAAAERLPDPCVLASVRVSTATLAAGDDQRSRSASCCLSKTRLGAAKREPRANG